jgi:hypothetical protein
MRKKRSCYTPPLQTVPQSLKKKKYFSNASSPPYLWGSSAMRSFHHRMGGFPYALTKSVPGSYVPSPFRPQRGLKLSSREEEKIPGWMMNETLKTRSTLVDKVLGIER